MSFFKNLIKNSDLITIILIIILVVEIIIAKSLLNNTEKLQNKVEQGNLQQTVFVVPESGNNKEQPADDSMLLSYFVDNVVNSFLSYNPSTFTRQAVKVSPYMTSAMFSKFNNFFFERLLNIRERPVSIFTIDKSKTEILAKDKFRDKTGVVVQEYDITIKGKRQFMTRNELKPLYDQTIKLSVRKSLITETNPYGFELSDFDLIKIIK